jgi:hypothetical protein
MVVNSLLFDHDLELTEDYRRVKEGGLGAGRRLRGAFLDHHTVLVDQAKNKSMLWQEVFDWRSRDCRQPNCEAFRRLTQDFGLGEPYSEVSAHPVAFPAFLALFAAPFRPTPQAVEHHANQAVQLLAFLGALLTYLGARAAGKGRLVSLLAATLLVFASPWLPYSRSFFVELPAGVLLIFGLWMLERNRPAWAGVAAGLALTLKPLFLVFGLGWLLERIGSRRFRDAVHIAVPMGLLGVALMVFNWVIARRLLVAGTSPWSWARGLEGLHANLFDGAHGVLPFAPWVAVALVPLVAALWPRAEVAQWVRQIALATFPYVAFVAANRYLGETCYGPRYWVALLPVLALAAVEPLGWPNARRPAALALVALGVLGLYIAIPAAFRYPELWDQPALAAWKGAR